MPPLALNPPPNLAPRWHTALLVLLIVTVASLGFVLSRYVVATPPSTEGSDRLASVYAPLLVVNVALVLYVVRVGRGAWAKGWLIGAWPHTARAVAIDLASAAALFVAIEAGEAAWALVASSFDALHAATAAGSSASSASAAPSGTSIEHLVWIPLAVVIGISEEIVYRGYLQMQLGAFLRSRYLGIVAQAALFGLAHLDQGGVSAARFAVYACGFGALAAWRKSLVPGIVCHVGIDLLAGWKTS